MEWQVDRAVSIAHVMVTHHGSIMFMNERSGPEDQQSCGRRQCGVLSYEPTWTMVVDQ